MALSCARTLPVALGRRRRRPRFQTLDKAVLPTISAMRTSSALWTRMRPLKSNDEQEMSTRHDCPLLPWRGVWRLTTRRRVRRSRLPRACPNRLWTPRQLLRHRRRNSTESFASERNPLTCPARDTDRPTNWPATYSARARQRSGASRDDRCRQAAG